MVLSAASLLLLPLSLLSVLLVKASPNGHLNTPAPFDLVRPASQAGRGARKSGVDTFRIHAPHGNNRGGDAELDEHELLDIVLLATVDGKFHALNRTSGKKIWSMEHDSDYVLQQSSGISRERQALLPLIGPTTTFPNLDGLESDSDEEQYIVEPQSGSIYVLPPHSTPSTPLTKLSFTIPQLVDMSPYYFPGDESRMWNGRKETRMIVLELESGRVRDVVDTEWECLWEPILGGAGENAGAGDEEFENEDENREGRRKVRKGTEIYIGRTDYRLQIHTKPSINSKNKKPSVKTLQYSSYGPNNLHKVRQQAYHRSPDNLYIQSLPNGEVYAFSPPDGVAPPPDSEGERRREGSEKPRWGANLEEVVVAVFDVLSPPREGQPNEERPKPYILLQPTPHISQIFPSQPRDRGSDLDVGDDVGWIGLIDGSLFVLGSEGYPLVIFGDRKPRPRRGVRMIDGREPAPTSPVGDDAVVTEPIPDEAYEEEEEEECHTKECLVGLRYADGRSGGRGLIGIEAGEREREVMGYIEGPNPSHPHSHSKEDGNGSRSGTRTGAVTETPRWKDTSSEGVKLINPGDEGHGWTKILTALLLTLLGMGVGGYHYRSLFSSFGFPSVPSWMPSRFGGESKTTEGDFMDGHPPPPSTFLIGNGSGIPDIVVFPPPPTPPAGEQSFEDKKLGNGIVETRKTNRKTPADPEAEGDDDFVVVPDGAATPKPNPQIPLSQRTPEEIAAEIEGDDHEREAEEDSGKKKKNRMRSRGKKKKAQFTREVDEREKEKEKARTSLENDKNVAERVFERVALEIEAEKRIEPVRAITSLNVSEEVLGFGSHGTMVFKGSFQGRAVAVKRLLQDFVTLASREVTLLQESDAHPNVIRYYFMEARANFLYIALELCPASLADIVERPRDNPIHTEIACSFDPKRALSQITSGLRWLHGLKIVHRDIKPQNILVAESKSIRKPSPAATAAGVKGTQYRMLISDFGLCKKLGADETSFLPTVHGAMAAGTVGWRAPEILRGDVKLDDLTLNSGSTGNGPGESSQSSRGSVSSASTATEKERSRTRLTKAVDIFALGCLFYYTLTTGGHPFGDRYEREVNIMKDNKDLSALEPLGEDGTEAFDLIEKMVAHDSKERPDTTTILLHPFFWTPARRLTFLQDASDRFEIMCRDPREPPLLLLEKGVEGVVGRDWQSRLDRNFLENLGKFRKYDGRSVQDLLRALRNKKHHYQDFPEHVKRNLGPLPEGFLQYFTIRFPRLFLHVYYVVSECGLAAESMFRSYFELADM